MRWQSTSIPRTAILCLCLLVSANLTYPIDVQEKLAPSTEAHLDPEGNVYVSSDQGKLIKMAGAGHCSEVIFASDRQTVACAVMKDTTDLSWWRLEIYLKGGTTTRIELGGLIREWHFWNDGRQVAVYSGPLEGPAAYALYDTASGRVLEKMTELPDESLLPQWAKSPMQLADESVPTSAALIRERTMWIAKVLRQIQKIKPGMRRKDLLKAFMTEGGLSNRQQQTFVYADCPYIKVDVRFRVDTSRSDIGGKDVEDVIETISRPYIAWSVMD